MNQRTLLLSLLCLPLFLNSCRKPNAPAPENKLLKYGQKYTHLMGGNRVWHRNRHSYTRTGADTTTIVYSDTTFSLTILGDVTIRSPDLGKLITLEYANDSILEFSGVDYYLGSINHPEYVRSAKYYIQKDSISIWVGFQEPNWDRDYYFTP